MTSSDESRDSKPGTTILHCSDLHFGRAFQHDVAEALLRQIEAFQPSAVVISGDLTMRARAGQFAQAREFIQKIKSPCVIVPGNHDVPLYNLMLRMTKPFDNYTTYTENLAINPLLIGSVAIYGINSVNPRRHQQGHFTREHLQAVSRWLGDLPASTWRLVVTHQHFVAIPGYFRPGAIRDAEKVLIELSKGGTHAILCGHMHFKYIGSTRDFFAHVARPIALVHAGTATSGRLRGPESLTGPAQVNNFMLLEFSDQHFTVTPYDWSRPRGEFLPGEHTVFDRDFYGDNNRTPAAAP